MKADWKDPKDSLPERRIRVIVCDTLGHMQTAYYGCQSSIAGEAKNCWRSDRSNDCLEKELDPKDVAFWDYLPKSPYPKRDIWSHEPLPETSAPEHKPRTFTGISDRNGKNLYEGDTVKAFNFEFVFKIVFEDGAYRLKGDYKDTGTASIATGDCLFDKKDRVELLDSIE